MTHVGLIYPYPDPLSPLSWSGTPRGLSEGLAANGVTVTAIGARLPVGVRQAVAPLSRATGHRGQVANRTWIAAQARTLEVARRVRQAGHLDALIAMDTEAYALRRVLPADIPCATYDDGTFALFARYPDSDIRRAGIPGRELDRWIERQGDGCTVATACCMSTAWAARSAVDDYGVPAERVHVVGMGHRARRAEDPAARVWGSPRFLFVGIDWARKNGAAVLEAFRAVRALHPDATLDLVGEHPSVDEPGVIGHGMLSRDDPAAQARLDDLYARSTAFVLPSRFDPSPIAYLEAASAGLPVVATTSGGAGELLGPGAITVDPDDGPALIAAMTTLADPARAQEIGASARERAEDATWMKVSRRILDTLSVA